MEKEIEYDGQNENCPCVLTGNPCRTTCTCMRSHMSGGCIYCPRYGSDEQRLNHARHIIQIFAREARLVEALELFADPDNWGQQQFESYDGDGIERVGFRYTFNDGDVDSDPITIAAEALAEYRGEK